MLELLFVMALTVLGVALAVLGVGMVNGTKKKKEVLDARSEIKKVLGAVVGVDAGIKDFSNPSGKGLLYDLVNSASKAKEASKDPYGHLYNNAPPEIKKFIKIAAGANALSKSLTGKNSNGANFQEMYGGLRGAVENARAAYDTPFGYNDSFKDVPNSITKEDINKIYLDLITDGEIPSDSHHNIKLVRTKRDPYDNPEYRGLNDGKNIFIEMDIYKNNSELNKAAQIYALMEELFHEKYKSEIEAKSKMHDYLMRNSEKYLDVIFAGIRYNAELKANNKHAS